MENRAQKSFNLKNLFTFEMANNHQGSVEHGKRIINAMADLADKYGIRAAIKFQFRDLDTFIHPAHKENSDNKHVPRFLSTRLNESQFAELVSEAKRRNMITMCTPFDELSVDKILDLDIEVIKVASCSAHDWPLLTKIGEVGRPVIVSTGGLKIREIDRIVSFFEHRGVQFALMHCVAMYPTETDKLHLNQIEIMRNRYPKIVIGFSTHEAPDNLTAVKLAYAKGARIFEKHVGVPTAEITLNKYSASPEQVDAWLAAWKEAVLACGEDGEREVPEEELRDLQILRRGVFVKKDIPAGALLKRGDVFFAFPLEEGQLVSGMWKEGLITDRDYKVNEAVSFKISPMRISKKDIIYSTIHAVKGMLNNSKIPLNHDFSVELSHHYGLERFHEIGCTLIECINKEYAKKLIIQLPGQWNPIHYHKKKDETFQILHGKLDVEIDGKRKVLEAGDTLWVPRGVWHGFGTDTGAIFEEVSTTVFGSDSFYIDRKISSLPREDRKTRLYNWGRHQLDEFDEQGNIIRQYI